MTIAGAADHETQSQYSFGVVATDAAGNASEAQSVTLDINDLDDAAPAVDSGDSADSVDENAASGQVVYTATADDSGDDVADGPILIQATGDSDSEFSIDSATGEFHSMPLQTTSLTVNILLQLWLLMLLVMPVKHNQ